MTARNGILVLALLTALCSGQEVSFNRQVLPILSENCFPCHGPDPTTREAGLRLDQRVAATSMGERGAAVAPGDPDASLLIRRITATDPAVIMPPPGSHKELSDLQRQTLRRWISEGAPYEQPWALVPPRRTPAPAVRDQAWSSAPLDRWLRARMEREGVNPAPPAPRQTLIRRLSLDLTGLPPSPAQVREFLEDTRDGAYEALVDRLLASPHYGERLAMYWLDLVRYADTVGYHGDQEHHIAPYRDWVIDAFNADMGFDRFTIEQLAGDLLEQPSPQQLIATGYNRVLQTTHEGGAQAKEYLTIYAADRVRNFGQVWLGATTGCAQCHDHKYDPYTTRDFYRLAAFFADIEEKGDFAGSPNSSPTKRPPEMVVDEASGRRSMITRARKEPRTVRVLPRGDWLDESGEVVTPQVPSCYEPLEEGQGRLTRLDLARWLVSGEHPQTARVLVNRLWYLVFGDGISRTLDDLGAQGEPPTHPELLDHLAIRLVEARWSLKTVIKELVMSRAYRQSSRAAPDELRRDPENRLYSRQGRWRLPAEMIRDNALTAAGLMVSRVGGDSVRPYQPAGLYRHMNFPPRKYKVDQDDRQWRRGVYMHWQRMFLHPMLLAFDAPTREEGCARRAVSNTPRAALTLLNDPTFVEAARHLAARCAREGDTDRRRLRRMFSLATGRLSMEEREEEVLLGLLRRHREAYGRAPNAAAALLAVGVSPAHTGPDTADLAAWTSVARTILNLDETITRR